MSRGKGKRSQPAIPQVRQVGNDRHPNLLLLDQFGNADLARWQKHSEDLDQLSRELYYSVEPERQRRHDELIAAINTKPSFGLDLGDHCRIVDMRWMLSPLSAAGSMMSYGGRFNIGQDTEESLHRPFPALYLAEDYQTAFRERFQIDQVDSADGLSPADLALVPSTLSVRLKGRLDRYLDVTDMAAIAPVAAVLKKIPIPSKALEIARRLKIGRPHKLMIRTAQKLQTELQANWRPWPIQYGMPGASQIFGSLAHAAGYEGIRYRSTKSKAGFCVAVFPSNIGSDETFVELADTFPTEVEHPRLDRNSAEALCGWSSLRAGLRPVA